MVKARFSLMATLFLLMDQEVCQELNENSELNVFKGMKFVGAISNELPNGLLGTNVYKTLESC